MAPVSVAVAVAAGTMPISSALGTYEALGSGRDRINDQVVLKDRRLDCLQLVEEEGEPCSSAL